MDKRIFALMFIVLLLAACGGQGDQTEALEPAAEEAVPNLVPGDLLDHPEQFVDQTVELTGTVQHVCEVTGKRMFLSGPDDPSRTFKVTAGKGIGEFPVALNGSDVTARGVVREQKVDQAFLDNWEAEIATGVKPEAAHEGHGSEGEGQESKEAEARAQLENMREKLAASGKEHLLFYSLECTGYSEKM